MKMGITNKGHCMGAWLNGVLSSEGTQSSSRLIAMMVTVIGGMLLAYDTFLHQALQTELFGSYLMFGAAIYGVKTAKEAMDAKKDKGSADGQQS